MVNMLFGSVKFEDILYDLKDLNLDRALKDAEKYERSYSNDTTMNKWLTEFIATTVSINKLNAKTAREYAFKMMKIDSNDISKLLLSLSYLIENDYENSMKIATDIIQNNTNSNNLNLFYINEKALIYMVASMILFSSNDAKDALDLLKNSISEDSKSRFLGTELLFESLIYLVQNENSRAKADLTNALQLGYRSNKKVILDILKLANNKENDINKVMPLFYDLRTDFIKDISYDLLYSIVFKNAKDSYYNGRRDQDSTGVTAFASAEKPKERYSDLVDMEKQKDELSKYLIYPLKYSDNLSSYGVKVGGGILLYGPPGCGKTFVVMATAGEADVRFIDVKIPDVVDELVGNTEKNIHNLFEYARENSPSIIFFDELDALGVSRNETGSAPWMRQAVNTMLSEMNNLYDKGYKVLVVGATNEPWLIDPALRRSGRFGNLIYAPPPNNDVRAKLFMMYLKGKPLATDIDFNKLAELAKNASHSDIKSICDDASREVWAKSIKTNVKDLQISMQDIVDAISKAKFVVPEWYAESAEALGSDINSYPELKDDIIRYMKENNINPNSDGDQ